LPGLDLLQYLGDHLFTVDSNEVRTHGREMKV